MNAAKLRLSVAAVLAALGIAACGGSDSTDTTTTDTSNPTKISGVITGFGSVFVNGVEYETTNAAVSVDGTAASEEQLAVGMVVTLEGTVNADGTTGVASAITFADEVEGVVLANDVGVDGTLDVMGQTVVVDAATQFESEVAGVLAPADIPVNSVVEVSGYSSGNGTIYATRIEVKADAWTAGEEIEVKGVVSALTDTTFALGSLTVDYSAAQLEDGVPVEGWYVEVKSTQGFEGGLLIASEVEKEGDSKGLSGEEGDETEIEGIVTSMADFANGLLELNGQPVRVTADTEYEHGTAETLAEGVRIEVEGAFDASGTLVAEEIKFREQADIELEATVDSIDTEAKSVTVLGQTFQVTNLTTMEDEQDDGVTPVRYFSLTDLRPGDTVEIHAYRDSAGALVATKLERDDPEGDWVELEGPIESVAASGQVVVAGVTVDLSGTAVDTGALSAGEKVEVTGRWDGTTLLADAVEIDD